MYDDTQPDRVNARALLDTRSQRSYVMTRLQEALGAKNVHSEAMIIKTFGAARGEKTTCNILQLKIHKNDCGAL